MFGELVAVWLISAWRAIGTGHSRSTIAEIGPGRGTLMKDMLRTLDRLEPGLRGQGALRADRDQPAARRKCRRRRSAGTAGRIDWHGTHRRHCRARPLLIVGNELFDAMPDPPVREDGRPLAGACGRLRRRRATSLSSSDAGALDPALLPPDAGDAPDGAIVEIAPARRR